MGRFLNCAAHSTEVSMPSSTSCRAPRTKTVTTKACPPKRDARRREPGLHIAPFVADSSVPASPEKDRAQVTQVAPFRELNDRLVGELIDAVKGVLRKETSDRLRDVYLIGDIEKDTARGVIERLRELANDNSRPMTLYINSAGGNVTDGLAIHDAVREIVGRHRGHDRRPGNGVFDGVSRPAGGQRGAAAVLPALMDHDSRAREMGGLAI